MTADLALLEDSAEDLFEDAPCGYLSTDLRGTIVKVNRTLETWLGMSRAELLDSCRFADLMAPGDRIYYETHYAPLLHMQGAVREIAVELLRADGSRLPVLLNSRLRRDAGGAPRFIRTTIFDATDRRRYEQELLRARRREEAVALQLQRSLLAGKLPHSDRLEVEVIYQPGERGLEVGGDWYDAFWLDDGESMGIVVGDVVGRGIEAAATMGQLRSALRALAATGVSPSALLEALDHYSRRHDVGRMATLVCAQLDLASGELRFACAGHPPPVVVPAHGPAAFAEQGRSTPLDATPGVARPREEGSCVLPPGSTLLLYTDGLLEGRLRPLPQALDHLLATAERHRDDTPAELARAVVEAVRDPEQRDDMCVLVARRRP